MPRVVRSGPGCLATAALAALAAMHLHMPVQVVFYLPQLVQCLRGDGDGAITGALLHMARASALFTHQVRAVVCNCQLLARFENGV